MPKGAFRVYQEQDDPRDIRFELCPDMINEVPQDQSALRDEVDRALVVLRMIFPASDSRFNDYFRQLLSLAQAGLVGDTAQPAAARKALLVLKDQITAQEGGRIKNKYMKELGWKALMIGPGFLVIGYIADWFLKLDTVLIKFLWLWVGCMAGVWLSFGARKRDIKFEELHVLEQDRLEPFVRLVFAGLLTVIVGLLFSTKVVEVRLGSVESWQFTQDIQIALLFGMLLGFSEQVLPTKVAAKATELLKLET